MKKTIFTTLALACITLLAAHAQPTDNVVAYYPFNGNANDVSGHGKNATVSGATLTTDRLGKANAAYYFNGSSNLIYLPTSFLTSSSSFSISCWVKINGNNFATTTDNGEIILDLRGQYQIALSYYESNHPTVPNAFGFYIYSNPSVGTIFTPNNFVQLNTWYHLEANYGNNNMEFYVNGVLMGTLNINPPSAVSGYNNTIGKDYYVGANRYWVYGCIDEVLVYSRKLTAHEVQTIYNRELLTSDIPELWGNIPFKYDAAGNRIGRNTILLKSAPIAPMLSDSAQLAGQNEVPEESFEKQSGDQKITIYPNPTRGELKVEITGFDFTLPSSVTIYSQAGKPLVQKSPATGSDVIDLSGYPNGMYILRVLLDGKKSEWKVLKE